MTASIVFSAGLCIVTLLTFIDRLYYRGFDTLTGVLGLILVLGLGALVTGPTQP